MFNKLKLIVWPVTNNIADDREKTRRRLDTFSHPLRTFHCIYVLLLSLLERLNFTFPLLFYNETDVIVLLIHMILLYCDKKNVHY